MIRRMPTHCFDDTCPSCVIADGFIFLAHHAGGFDQPDVAYQARAVFERMKSTLASAGATLNDMVQINLYLRHIADFEAVVGLFEEYFSPGCFPARMTLTTDFIDAQCLCQMDGIARLPQAIPSPADELLQWKRLLDEGIISPKEFDALKRKLLAL